MSMAEIKAQITSAMEQANEAGGSVDAARSQLESAVQTAAAATQDTSNSMPGEAMGQWQQASERLEEALQLIQAGNSTFEQYMSAI